MPETRELYVTLTADEREAKGRALAAVVEKISAAQEAKTEAARHHKSIIDALDDEKTTLAEAINTGREKRAVPVTERRDLRRFCTEVVRIDTMEVVDTLPFDADEIERVQQPGLFARGTADSTDDAPPADAAKDAAAEAVADAFAGGAAPDAPESAVNAVGMLPEDEGDPADPATEISDPATILDGAADEEDADADA